jgi:hypothetical protein
MGSRELQDWEAYYAVEPWGQLRDNMHAGMIASLLANQGRKRGSRAQTYEDFLLVPAQDKFEDNRKRFFGSLKSLAKRGG